MTGFVKKYLRQFGRKTPKRSQHQPYPEREQTYVTDAQKTKQLDMSPALQTKRVKKENA